MALDFGKVAFSVSFDPTFAFPVDARSYFESYDAAVAAAASAKEAGSSESVYYYGQTLVVVENDKATFYIIQPDNTLVSVGDVSVDTKQFEFDDEGNLSLKGFDSASLGQILTVGENGELTWTTPINTYTKTEIDQKIAEANHLKRKIFTTIEEAKEYIKNNADANQYIFMIGNGLENDADKYDEYLIVDIAGVPTLEPVGSWEVDLGDYVKQSELEEQLNAFNQHERNIINSVSSDFTIDENRKLHLNTTFTDRIIDIEKALNNKYDKTEGYLISEYDKQKLDALQFNGNDLQISGKVNTSQIIDLTDWLNNNAGNVKGLSENNLDDDLYNKLVDLLFISSVNSNQMVVSDDGQLSITNIDYQLIGGLDAVLQQKANESTMLTVQSQVKDLTDELNDLSKTVSSNTTLINDLDDRLTWKEI